ncbi:MAG: molybdopterin converting factor subunit 1 [Planctomycetes bacterium]|nr:molybdopterin converting factor subunit 1 [Planctomycetota bacterium]
MIVRVKLFAVAKDLIGNESLEVELPEFATVSQLRTALESQFPQLSTIISHLMIAVDAEYANDQTVLTENSEIACIPPVSGG